MAGDLRETGIGIIGGVPWSSHFCQFYQTKEDLIDILVPYFKSGLENNEFCMWITAEPLTAEEACRALAEALPEFNRYLAKGQIEIIPFDKWYVPDGCFESRRVLDGWIRKLDQALASGFAGLRLSGNTFWLEKKDWKSFADYEETINSIISGYKILALCTYCLDKCNSTEILDVVRNHEFALIKQDGRWEVFESSSYKATKEALAESEAKFRQLFLSMQEGVSFHEIVYDSSGKAVDYRITDVNPIYETITGLSRAEAVGSLASELYGSGEAPYLDIYAEIAETGSNTSFETYYGPMDRYFRITAFSAEKGRFVTVFSDITEHRRTEQSLKEGQRDLNRAQAVAHTGSWRLDLKRNKLLWSDETYRIFDIPRGTPMTYDTFLSAIYPPDREYVDERWQAALKGEVYDIEHRITAGGKIKWVREKAELEFDLQGELTGGFGTIQDVTERKSMEEALRARDAEISAILDAAPMLMVLVDPERRVLQSNLAAARFAGRVAGDMQGLRAGEALRCMHSLDAPSGCGFGPSCETCLTRLTIQDTFATGRGHYQVEWHLPFDRGDRVEELTFLLYTLPIDLPQKSVLVCIQDVTELKKSEKQIKELNEALSRRALELEAANNELEAFSYSVSHDLRAPLRSLDGFSQAIMEDYADKLDDTGREYLGYIRSSSQLMARLIDDLLNLSRITRAEINLDRVDLSRLAETVAQDLIRSNPERKVEFKITPNLAAYGDERLLKLAFENLLGNAFKFTGKRPLARIEFGVVEQQGKPVFCIRDNGAGFDMSYADKLFKPFQRLHTEKEFAGTGIGLASVQRIINRLGGRIWAEGQVDGGAAFYFILPQNDKRGHDGE